MYMKGILTVDEGLDILEKSEQYGHVTRSVSGNCIVVQYMYLEGSFSIPRLLTVSLYI